MRKQTKPEVYLDHYLETIGLWRKPVAREGLCLFRAVSEQLFKTQVYHTSLYEACKLVFLHCGKDMETEWTELVVMEILSKMYRRDFLVYEEVGHLPTPITHNGYKDKILLCRTGGNQLDSVYPASFQQSSAICQSILYQLLYRDVFKLDSELSEAVTLIRDQNKKKISLLSNRFDDLPDTNSKRPRESPTRFRERYIPRPTPPLPYRIAKALDPCIYRNVELDIWEEEKREQKRESQEHRDKFAPGDKCLVILEGDRFCGHIQEINNEDNTAVVFIEELGEKQSVAVSCLKISPYTRHSLYSRHKFQKHKQIQSASPCSLSNSNYIKGSRAPTYQNHYQTGPLPIAAELDLPQGCETNQGFTLGQGYSVADSRMTNLNNSCVRMDTSALQGNLQNSKTNLNQYTSSMLQQYAAPGMNQAAMQQSGYMYGPMVPQGSAASGYACICVPYLDSIAVRDVNINCYPSQDTAGKDLPEMNSLRFFYNLGVENYRNISQTGTSWPGMEMGPMMPSADQINGNINTPYALPPPPLPITSSPNGDHSQQPATHNQTYMTCSAYSGLEQNKADQATGSPKLTPTNGDKASMADESHDSGCDSDSASGIAHDDSFKESDVKLKLKTTSLELEQKIDSYIATNDVEMEAESADAGLSTVYQTQHNTRAKKPRKYYIYGNHKLIKPIKDIPPRFLSLLQSSSAERARCEGEPIIVPMLPHKYNQSYRPNAQNATAVNSTGFVQHNGFNPEAKCFIPNPTTQSLMQDPSIIACKSGQAVSPGDPYQTAGSQNSASYSCSPLGNGVTPMYVHSHLYPQTNPGTGSSITNFPGSSSNTGDGSKLSMPPSLLTGQACPSYPPSMQYPMYYAGQNPYNGTQGLMLPSTGLQGTVGFTQAYHQSQAFGMQPHVTQVSAVQAAQ